MFNFNFFKKYSNFSIFKSTVVSYSTNILEFVLIL